MSSVVFMLIFIVGCLICQQPAEANHQMLCPEPSNAAAIKRLKSALFCEYDPEERPVKNTTANTTIFVNLKLIHFTFDDTNDDSYLTAVMLLDWRDEHLTWERQDYDNIEQISVLTSQIWKPDLTFHYSADTHAEQITSGATHCILDHWGNILCTPNIYIQVTCQHKIKSFPFDVRICELNLGSLMYDGRKVDLQMYLEGLDSTEYQDNPEWKMVNTSMNKYSKPYACCPNEPFIGLRYTFKLERLGYTLYYIYIVPAWVFALITLASFFASKTTTRVLMCLVAVLCNLTCVINLQQRIPATRALDVPEIVQFYVVSIVLSGLAVCIAILVSLLDDAKGTPKFAQKVVTWIQMKRRNRDNLSLIESAETDSAEGNESVAIENGHANRNNEGSVTCNKFKNISFIINWLSFAIITIIFIF